MGVSKRKLWSGAAVLVAAVGLQGCATKKYVRQTVDPVNSRVATVEKKASDTATELETVSSSANRANERAGSAEKLAQDAGSAAQRANDAAGQAGQRADQARSAADAAGQRAGAVEQGLQNIDNFKPVTDLSVLFRTGSSVLSKDALAQLDGLAQSVSGMRRYVLEVTGFTDTTGSAASNVILSERRANAVIRYLTGDKQIPLRNIRVIGMGESTQQESGREGRKMARHVAVRVFAPADVAAAAATTTTSTTPAATSTPRTND